MIGAPELLHAGHHRSDFDCGKPALNDWLKNYAVANQERGFTRVIVVCEGTRVVGFYGLAPTAVPPPLLSRSLRTGRHPDPIPAILLGQFAVDKAYAGRRIGSALLRHALTRAVAGAEVIGGRALIVRAIDEEAERYWQSNGFIAARDDPSLLFRSVADIATWLKALP
jgi:GNAT superfamily N-acetyltransferase